MVHCNLLKSSDWIKALSSFFPPPFSLPHEPDYATWATGSVLTVVTTLILPCVALE